MVVGLNARIAAFVAAVLAGVISPSRAQEPTAAGLWQWQHAESRQPISWFLFVERNGVFEGYIAKLFPPSEHIITACTLCTDDRKDAPPLGLSFMRGMKRAGLTYEDGTVLDPRSGKIYNARMRLSPDNRMLALTSSLPVPGLIVCPDHWHRLPDSAFNELDPAIIKISEPNLSRQAK